MKDTPFISAFKTRWV